MKKYTGKEIFFTDEKRLLLNPPLNNQTNQISLNNSTFLEYKNEKVEYTRK